MQWNLSILKQTEDNKCVAIETVNQSIDFDTSGENQENSLVAANFEVKISALKIDWTMPSDMLFYFGAVFEELLLKGGRTLFYFEIIGVAAFKRRKFCF